MKNKEKLKKILLILFMFLLLVFVCLMCYIIIWDKNNPKKQYLSQDSIKIVDLNEEIYDVKSDIYNLKRVKENQEFLLNRDDIEYKVIVNEYGDLNIIDNNEIIKLRYNEEYISEKIIFNYEYLNDIYLLTDEFNMYKIVNKNIDKNDTITIEKIDLNEEIINIIDTKACNIKGLYAETKSGNVVNVYNGSLYNGVNYILKTEKGNLIKFDDNSISFNKNTKVVNNGQPIKISFLLDNIVIDDSSTIYNVDYLNSKISTSNMGQMTKISYYKDKDNIYSITIESTTGVYNIKSSNFINI